MREVARYDAGRYGEIARWPLRELLISYVQRLKELTAETFRHTQLLYQVRNAFGGKEEPPPVPALLRETPNNEHS